MIVDVTRHGRYRLTPDFVAAYRQRPVPWGFGALSEVTYLRTYSRDGESWWQTCQRVVEGMFTVLRAHCAEHGAPWDTSRARAMAEEAYARLFEFKWTPPGRGLWIMGTDFIYERGGAALNNCGFVSTADLAADYAAPFVWMLQMTMLGIGVGFDTAGRDRLTLNRPAVATEPHVVEDSREGWAAALARLLGAYSGRATLPSRWDTSRVRPAGSPLRGIGSYASGPEPLEDMLAAIGTLNERYVGRRVDSRLIVDTMNLIGRGVVAGGVRRSAQIAFGDALDRDFLALKSDPERVRSHGWVSNNSVYASAGMDYHDVAAHTAVNGEPGFFWLDNARAFGRMGDPPDWADAGAMGSNPCVEQTLWDRELCTLVETFPARHADYRDFERTVRLAFLYGKAVTLVPTGVERTDAVMQRNRRIGCSMTGVVQAINRHGYRRFLGWCDSAYRAVRRTDDELSAWLRVNRSIKTTSIKPSGTVSLLAGATPGVHWDHAPYYIRRVRVRDDHPLIEQCRRAGYAIETDAYATRTQVVAFPVQVADTARRKRDVPLWEKVDLAAQMQRYWSDNQVSCTAEFDPARETDALVRVLEAYEDRLKAVVFLPESGHGYEQPPYEAIDERTYREMSARLRPLAGPLPHDRTMEEWFCEGDYCERPRPDGGGQGR